MTFMRLPSFYRPQTKLPKGNVFILVCQSFCSPGEVCRSACWDTPPPPSGQTHPVGRHPSGQTLGRHPWADTPADGYCCSDLFLQYGGRGGMGPYNTSTTVGEGNNKLGRQI